MTLDEIYNLKEEKTITTECGDDFTRNHLYRDWFLFRFNIIIAY